MSHIDHYQYPVSFIHTAAKSWLSYGVNTETVLALSDIDIHKLEDQNATLSLEEIKRLLVTSQKFNATGTPESILVAEQFSFTNVGLLGLAVTASKNLESVLELLTRFLSSVAPGLSISYHVSSNDLYIDYQMDSEFEDARPFFNEVVVCVMLRFADLFESTPTPSIVYFAHSPAYPKALFEQHLGCPVETNYHINRLCFAVKELETPLKHPDSSTLATIEKQLQNSLNKTASDDSWIQKVRQLWHIRAKQQQFLSQKQMADELNISPRTLVRRLAEERSNYRTLTQQWRLESAKMMLKQTDHPISDVALKVGFEDESAFFRFFKNAVGVTPRNYRFS